MNAFAQNRSAAVSPSTSRSACITQACCGWSATQPRSTRVGAVRLCYLLGSTLLCFATNALATELTNPDPSPSNALFDPSRIMRIEIQLKPEDWHELRIGYRTLVGMNQLSTTEKPYPYFRADVVIDGRNVSSVGVRKKGSLGSMISSRPSLKLKFDELIPARDFLGLEMLTLNNDVQDVTHACQVLNYAFMRRAGVPAPRCSLARVVVNGEDLGIYSHVETIDRRFLRRHFANASGDLYEGQNGGDFSTNMFPRILHKRGGDKQREWLARQAALLDDSRPLSLDRLESWLDVDAFIRFWAAEMLIGNRDGYAWASNNYYLYRDGGSGRLSFIPWGRDTAFAPQGDWWGTPVPKSVVAFGLLCERLWELPEIRERYRREMNRQLAVVWNEDWLREELARVKKLCAEAGALDEGASKPGFERIEEFITRRRAEVECEMDRPFGDLPKRPRWGSKPRAPDERPIMRVQGSFAATLKPAAPTNRLGEGAASIEYDVRQSHHTPFTRYEAVAFPAKNDYRDVVAIEIDALDERAGLRWRVMFHVDPYRVRPGPQKLAPFAAFCRVVQGDPDARHSQARGSYTGLAGALVFEQASTNLGATLSGNFTFEVPAFDGEKRP